MGRSRRLRRWAVRLFALGGVAATLVSCRTMTHPSTMPPAIAEGPASAPSIEVGRGIELFLESSEPGAEVLELPQSLVHIRVRTQPVLTGADVAGVEVVGSELGKALQVKFRAQAAHELQRVSGAAGGRRLVLTINRVPLGALRLSKLIVDGQIAVFLELPDAYLPRLLTNLKAEGVPVVEGAP